MDVVSTSSPLRLNVTLLCEPLQDMTRAEQIADSLMLSFETGMPVLICATRSSQVQSIEMRWPIRTLCVCIC